MIRYFTILLVSVLTTGIVSAQSLSKRNGRTKQGNCFCNSGAKNKGAWYVGGVGKLGVSSYNGSEKSSFPAGIHIGTNITKMLSMQLGASYSNVRDVTGPIGYATADYDFIDFSVDLIARFPNENNAIVPYVVLGVDNNYLFNTKLYPDAFKTTLDTKDELRYNASYLKLAGGVYFILSEKISVFTEPFYKKDIAEFSGVIDGREGYGHQFGIGLGINYHF